MEFWHFHISNIMHSYFYEGSTDIKRVNVQVTTSGPVHLLRAWGLSPSRAKYLRTLYRFYFWHCLIFGVLLFEVLMILQITTNADDMDEIIKVFFMLAPSFSVLGKYLTIKLKIRNFKNHFKLILNVNYLPKNGQENDIFLKYVKQSQTVRDYYGRLSISSLVTMFLTQYLNASKELPVPVFVPFEMNTNWKYNLVYLYQCLSISFLCLVNVSFDTLSTTLFIHLRSQLDILAYRLENIGQHVKTDERITRQLKDCIRYCNRIRALSQDIEYLVSIPITIQISCSVLVLIANFYFISLLSATEEIAEFGRIALYQACMLAQVFILCYFANEVTLKSDKISYNLYSSEWYNWNWINRKLVLIMMLRFKVPIRISSINPNYSFNLSGFTTIVNSSYSYYAWLRNMNA
ncbi:hypothetical protein DOY81_010898 [Sarcophaga bullata]|nr:hypothetical protein DOY81_010898 [Sarcophaga bullata]